MNVVPGMYIYLPVQPKSISVFSLHSSHLISTVHSFLKTIHSRYVLQPCLSYGEHLLLCLFNFLWYPSRNLSRASRGHKRTTCPVEALRGISITDQSILHCWQTTRTVAQVCQQVSPAMSCMAWVVRCVWYQRNTI